MKYRRDRRVKELIDDIVRLEPNTFRESTIRSMFKIDIKTLRAVKDIFSHKKK